MASFSSKRAERDVKRPRSFISPAQDKIEVKAPLKNHVSTETTTSGLYRELPSSLEIRPDQLKGRGVWSKGVFKRGSILLSHRPHVSVLSTQSLPTNCAFCVSSPKNNETLKRCTKCKLVWYCSSACQNADWPLHKHECSAISRWVSSSPDGPPPGEAVRSLGRLLWGRKVEGETSPWWKEIQALQSHRASLPPSAIETHTRLAHALVRYLGVTSPVELAPYGIQSSGDLVDLISRFTTNTFTLTSPSLTPLGTCVSPLAALFNHACLPNAIIVFPHSSRANSQPALQEPVLHVIALKNISPGEEVLTAYIDTTLPTPHRQQALKETYNFTCTCPLCTSTGLDPRESLWCPKDCGGMCSAPFSQELSSASPQCAKCKATFTRSNLHDIEDQRRIGQEALDKATSLQFSEPAKALNLTSHILPLLSKHFPPTSHPTLALLRLHQSLLISALASAPTASSASDPSTPLLDNTIRATARAVAGLTAVLDEGHPVLGIAITELGKLLAVDPPRLPPPQSQPSLSSPSSSSSSSSSSGISTPPSTISTSASPAHPQPQSQSTVFPPADGAARLALAIDTLKRALKHLLIGFGSDESTTQGGQVRLEVREDIVRLEKELGVWHRGVRNALQNMTPSIPQK